MKKISNSSFNGNANDESGNGIIGEVNGAVLTSDRFGNPNRSFLFDGIDDHIWLTNASNLHFGNQDFSISVWIELASLEVRGQAIFSTYHASGDREYILSVHPTWDTIYMKIYDQGKTEGGNIVHTEKSLRIGKSTTCF